MAPSTRKGGARVAPVLLGLLVVAALSCAAVEATARHPATGVSVGVGLGVDVKLVKLVKLVKVTLYNHAHRNVRLVVATGEAKGPRVLDCNKGGVAVLGPVHVRVEAVPLVRVDVFVCNSKGQLLKLKATALLKLGVVADVLQELVLTVREDVTAKEVTLLDHLNVVAKLHLNVVAELHL